MIYEKRQEKNIRVRSYDLASKIRFEPASSPAVYDSSKQHTTSEPSYTGTIAKYRRRRKKRRILSAAVAVILCLSLGFFAEHLGVIYPKLIPEASKQDSSAASSLQAPRTIYTLTYADSPEQEEYGEEKNIPLAQADSPSADTEDIEETVAVDAPLQTATLDGVRYLPIVSQDFSKDDIYALSNGTGFGVDMASIAESTPSSLENLSIGTEPLVLILHTHACESYSGYTGMYPENAPTRSEDTDVNVTRVGREIASVLSDFGISSVHCDILHDSRSFINAYSESAKTVETYLEKYPSIRFVLDVHRDAIIRDNGESVKPLVSIAGEDYAQIMFVVGTNELGHNHPAWKDNLSLAATLQGAVSDTYPGLCRSINLRNVPFNQQLSSGYLLVEVGSCANTLDEALRSARAFGQEFARVLLKNGI